ncbi:MAG: cytidine deaminase [Phycisphaerae bacterium]|nr:cytidine deaminase [Phycisphaerae bacterium]
MDGSLTQQDEALLEAARKVIAERFRQGYHHVAAAVRTRSGRTFAGVHLEANVGRVAVCAEAIAIGAAAAAGDTELETIVCVDRKGNVVSPCGMCRELISDYSPDCRVIVPNGRGDEVVPVSELLPNKYRRRWREGDVDSGD